MSVLLYCITHFSHLYCSFVSPIYVPFLISANTYSIPSFGHDSPYFLPLFAKCFYYLSLLNGTPFMGILEFQKYFFNVHVFGVRLQNYENRLLSLSCLSVRPLLLSLCPHGTPGFPLNRFLWNLVIEDIRKSIEKIQV
jgi:hypothetical protein